MTAIERGKEYDDRSRPGDWDGTSYFTLVFRIPFTGVALMRFRFFHWRAWPPGGYEVHRWRFCRVADLVPHERLGYWDTQGDGKYKRVWPAKESA